MKLHNLLLIFTATALSAAEPQISSNAFGFDIMQPIDRLQNEQGAGNWLYSPYSLFSCLSMAASGAKETTLAIMKKTLHWDGDASTIGKAIERLSTQLKIPPSSKECTMKLKNVNALFADQDTIFLSPFRKIVDQNYHADLQSITFSQQLEATQIINKWADDATDGKIKDLLHEGDIDPSTRVVLVNAIYFSGQWQNPFSKTKTKKQPFLVDKTSKYAIDMMQQTATFPYFDAPDCQIISLPFRNCSSDGVRPVCWILLPTSNDALADLQKSLTPEKVAHWMTRLEPKLIDLSLPSFCLKKRLDMQTVLTMIGMGEPFTEKANFSGIDGMGDLFLSKVVHEAYFNLNELGIEAAAATAAAINTTAINPSKEPPIVFRADHPFLFMLLDANTGTLLFFGKFCNPTLSGCQ